MTLINGTILHGRYRIMETLGQGGMGAVYHAVDERLGVDVAVKENLFINEAYARQFRREATTLASLRHPSLPRVTDHFEGSGETQYLVMDYIEGEDLRQWMENNGLLNERNAIVIGITISNALSYLHAHDPIIVHRDIKPGNIRITSEGRIFLVDFGLVKMLQGGQSTTAGARAMTPGYSPPEQYGTSHTDPRSDIYSLGATLYVALSGNLPEDGLGRVMGETRLTPIRKYKPRISHALAIIIEKAMSVQPWERYQSADALRYALYKAAETTKTPVHNLILYHQGNNQTHTTTQPRKSDYELNASLFQPNISIPRRWGALTLVLLSLVLLLFGFWALLGFPPFQIRTSNIDTHTPNTLITPSSISTVVEMEQNPPSPPNMTMLPAANLTVTNVTAYPPQVLSNPKATPLGGGMEQIVFTAKTIGPLQLYTINIDGNNLKPITRQPGGACQPSWSASGEKIVFTSPCIMRRDWYERSNLFITNPDGSNTQRLTNDFFGDFDAVWSPVQPEIAFTSMRMSSNPRVHILSMKERLTNSNILKTNPTIQLLTNQEVQSMQPAWSPKGNTLVFVSNSLNGSQLWFINADGSNPRPFSADNGYYNHPRWSPDGKTLAFNYRKNVNGFSEVMLSEVDNFSPRPLIDLLSPRMDAEFSPDGQWLVYEGWPEGDRHSIWFASRDGKSESRIPIQLENSSAEFNPVWRPSSLKPNIIFH